MFARICLLYTPNLFVPVLNIKKKKQIQICYILYNSSKHFTNIIANFITKTLILSLLILLASSCIQEVELNIIFRDIQQITGDAILCQKKPPEVFYRKMLKNSKNSHENTCARVSFLIKLEVSACNFIKKETLAQMLSCEFGEIFKNTFFTQHLRATTFTWCLFEHCRHRHILF